MTKYVLNSGGMKNHPELAKPFFSELVKGLGGKPRFLLCYFAQPREDWDKKFLEEKKTFPDSFPEGVNPTFELAFPDTFNEQVSRADVIYLRGGDDHLLQYWLRKFDVPSIWKGKVVAGSSAGSSVLSKHFWTCDWRECLNGLGLLQIKFIPHYESSYGNDDSRGPIDWHKAYETLHAYKETSLPIHALKEGHYIVINM